MLKLLFVLPLLLIALYAENLSSNTIIDNMISAYGGEKALQQLNNYNQVWHIETKTTDTNGTDERIVNMPSSLTTKLTYPHKSEMRILHNDFGIKKYGDRESQAKGPMLDAMKLQLMRLYSPLVLQSKKEKIKLLSQDKYYKLILHQGSITAEYFVSKTTYLIEKVIGRLTIGSQQMEFLTFYDDYKDVNGVMIPYIEIKYAGNVNTAIMHLKETNFIQAVSTY